MNLICLFLCFTLQIDPRQVSEVVDGDTFTLWNVGVTTREKVRVLGVDTPEHNQPGFDEATKFTEDWLKKGPFSIHVCIRDSFGRLLAEVSRGSERLDMVLIEAGKGKRYVR